MSDWVLMSYRLPREPSTPRITLWRRLRSLGVAQLLDGLVALPLDPRNREQLEWLAQEVREAGGTVTIWTACPTSKEVERSLIDAMKQAIGAEYQQVVTEAETAASQPEAVRGRSLARLRREMRRIRSRDYFQGVDRERAAAAIEHLASLSLTQP